MKNIFLALLIVLSITASGQTLYVPSGTSGIGTSTVSGNVGIGTSSPLDALNVAKTGNNQLVLQDLSAATDGVGGGIKFLGNTNGTAGGNYFATIQGVKAPTSVGGILKLYTSDNSGNSFERLRVDYSGNVGIGTVSPGGKLHVDGSAYIGNENGDGLYRVSIGASGGDYGSVGYGYRYSTTTNSYSYAVYDYASQLKFDNGGFSFFTASSGTTGGAVTFSRAMTIFQNGNVGIGSSSPDAKLAVKGQIHANEVKVDLAVPGPDYVFEKDYKLTSLEDIKTYIDQNKQLPEMPSATDMEKNGVQLGEMNMLLLKKIEELTLYMIDLKNENDKAKKQMIAMQSEIEQLKNSK